MCVCGGGGGGGGEASCSGLGIFTPWEASYPKSKVSHPLPFPMWRKIEQK